MENLLTNPIIQITVSFILGIAVSYYFYILTTKTKASPKWAVTSSFPVLNQQQNIAQTFQIKFNEELFEKITATTICFWNDGKKGISQSNLSGPISFQLEKGVKIVSLVSIHASSKSIGISVKEEETLSEDNDIQSKVLLNFHILNQLDGIVFTILHTGNTNTEITTNVSILDATLVEAPAFPNQEKIFREKIFWKAYLPLGIIIILVINILRIIIINEISSKSSLFTLATLLGAMSAMIIFSLALFLRAKSYLPKWAQKYITKGL